MAAKIAETLPGLPTVNFCDIQIVESESLLPQPLRCGGRGDLHRGCAGDKSAATL